MGMGIIAKETLANGRLTDRNNEADFAGKKATLEGLAHECQTTLDALAIAFVHNQPFIDIALSGATTPQHLQSNIHALEINWSHNLDQTLRQFSEDKNEYWAKRSQLAWN
jgi:aryl-alcohol dehydrogenase-like predicted oxidoreductase